MKIIKALVLDKYSDIHSMMNIYLRTSPAE